MSKHIFPFIREENWYEYMLYFLQNVTSLQLAKFMMEIYVTVQKLPAFNKYPEYELTKVFHILNNIGFALVFSSD